MIKEQIYDFKELKSIHTGLEVQLSDLLSVNIRTNVADLKRSGKPILFKNQIFGELHIGGVKDEFGEHDKNLSPLQRAHYFMAEAVEGLENLSTLCKEGDPRFKDVWLFLGISDVLRPQLIKFLGFSEDHLVLHPHQKTAQEILKQYRDANYDIQRATPKTVYEFWLPRNELEEKHELLGEKLEEIEQKYSIPSVF